MDLPQYVTAAEVQRVCAALKIRDWTQLADGRVLPEEAQAIMAQLDLTGITISVPDFLQGLEVELEHGTRFPEANVTNNHPLLTGKIVLAHLKESLIYYKRLEVSEFEGDLFKAVAAGKADKAASVYARLARSREELALAELAKLG
jgi:hypothetical protein